MESEFQTWVEKHRAQFFRDIKGQDKAIRTLKEFIVNFPSKRALLLCGPAGTGKTSLAHIAKKELELELYELNASDFRNKEQLDEKLKPASEQKSLFNKGKILLVDEVDGLSYLDKGGLPELITLIEKTQFPMIITANNIWDKKFAELRKKCVAVELKDVDYKDISLILQEIAKKESLPIDNQVLISIAIKAKGDVRAAINDLQTISTNPESIKNYMSIDERNRDIDIFNALKLVFKEMLNEKTLRIYDQVDMPLDKIFLWIEENIPNEYSGEEMAKAYDILSLADIFRGRIRRQRYWRFLVYQNILLSAGISLAKKKPKSGFTHYQRPTRVLKIWMSNNKNKHKETIIAKYANKVHCSKKKAYREFNTVKVFLRKPEIQEELKLSGQEREWLAKTC